MLTLALDTANRRGGIALAHDGAIAASRTIEAPDGFAGVVFAEIESLLAAQGLRVQDVDVWAPAAGPGSFTGVRIGLAAAKALAEVSSTLVVPIGNLEALAFAGRGDLRAAVLDARRGQVFSALYDAHLGPLLEPTVGSWEDFRAALGKRMPVFATIDAELFGSAGPAHAERPDQLILVDTPAASIALLAERRARAGETVPLEQVQPIYVRRPDVREPE
ncbi:MAG: tRNA (adenosine(37)-N6)-threonylcarbamoyltransferase complex dimerization subunit type 1 TsaB [Acidobacteria bacterium]|nr:tRNA (adenosine(37)-N6)-threonylcarbamoyltransferase complex dimerization subunit type 1 TsaB [Acidobacteriota bacterium]MDA1233711.1 tRNA (adenosine(37)-N6)-threonylcarbamoyltransferase complex dimerization subunit type 1 TsaB [Acidobacteriota bacterium]